MADLLGNARPSDELLADLRQRGGAWAAYQNVDMSSAGLGHLKFLKVGDECTFKLPPEVLPDGPDGSINWRYYYVGILDLETGAISKGELPAA